MKKVLIFVFLMALIPKIGFTKPYKADFYYPSGDGPFPVVIMSQYIVENMKTQVIAIVIRNAFKKWKENKQSKQKTNKKDD